MIIIETCPECGHDLVDMMLASNPPILKKKCLHCGWSWTGKREEVVRIPFSDIDTNIDDTVPIASNDFINATYEDSMVGNCEQSACINCPNNPKNGGSGVCHCILGQQTIYY